MGQCKYISKVLPIVDSFKRRDLATLKKTYHTVNICFVYNACFTSDRQTLQSISGKTCYGCINHDIHRTYGKKISTLAVLEPRIS